MYKKKSESSSDEKISGETSSESELSSESGDNDNDVEELEDYHVDGYHPAHIGEIVD